MLKGHPLSCGCRRQSKVSILGRHPECLHIPSAPAFVQVAQAVEMSVLGHFFVHETIRWANSVWLPNTAGPRYALSSRCLLHAPRYIDVASSFASVAQAIQMPFRCSMSSGVPIPGDSAFVQVAQAIQMAPFLLPPSVFASRGGTRIRRGRSAFPVDRGRRERRLIDFRRQYTTPRSAVTRSTRPPLPPCTGRSRDMFSLLVVGSGSRDSAALSPSRSLQPFHRRFAVLARGHPAACRNSSTSTWPPSAAAL